MKLTRSTNQYQSLYFNDDQTLVARFDKHAQGRLSSGVIRIKLPDGKSATHVISGNGYDTDSVDNVSRMIDELTFDLVIAHGQTKEHGIHRSEFMKMTREEKHKWLKKLPEGE